MKTADSPLKPYAALLIVQLTFGSLPVIGKVVLAVIPSLAFVGFRVGITAVSLFIIQLIRRRVWLANRSDYWRLAVLSIFGVVLNQILFIGGLSLTKASNVSLLAVTIPIFTLTVGALAGFEKLRAVKIAGIILAAAGVVFLIDPRSASFSSATTLGDILIVLNSLSYGIYVAVSKDIITRNGAFRSMMWIFIFASVVCVPLGFGALSAVDVGSVAPSIWAWIFYSAMIATVVPYIFNAWALARVNPSTVAVFIYLQPIIGFTMAAIFLGEKIDLNFLIAAALVFAGVYLVVKKRPG